jgi:hypothetical protein
VAVFPVQICWIWPRVSGAYRFLTNKLSFFMTSTEKAIAIETASGRPSGTATITIETPIVKYLRRV